jgi:predicted nucleic acid-binding protein
VPTRARLRSLRADAVIAVTEPIVMELLSGCRERDVARFESFFGGFPDLAVDPYLDFRQAASIRRRVRLSGHTVRSAMDGLIASVVMRHPEARLIHNDVDFERIAVVVPLRQERWGL